MLSFLLDIILHLDTHLASLTATYGTFTYAILFTIIFCETGLVVTPFLPGDSLLFAAGAIAALGNLNPWAILSVLAIAAILGDTVNYWIGHFFGNKIIALKRTPIKKEHIEKTHAFFQKHGGKTIILARFVPIVRTFAPFVAGIGAMHYKTFITYNIVGGVAWVSIFTLTGYFFGNIPAIKHNFTLVIFAIIGISLVPMFVEILKSKRSKTHTQPNN
jgi:membrane-associated protein